MHPLFILLPLYAPKVSLAPLGMVKNIFFIFTPILFEKGLEVKIAVGQNYFFLI
jgi:hypothetical protein